MIQETPVAEQERDWVAEREMARWGRESRAELEPESDDSSNGDQRG